jgi:hypothetical protein
VSGTPVVIGPSGKTTAPVTITLVPVPGKPHGPIIRATAKPLSLKPVVVCATGTTTEPPLGAHTLQAAS